MQAVLAYLAKFNGWCIRCVNKLVVALSGYSAAAVDDVHCGSRMHASMCMAAVYVRVYIHSDLRLIPPPYLSLSLSLSLSSSLCLSLSLLHLSTQTQYYSLFMWSL